MENDEWEYRHVHHTCGYRTGEEGVRYDALIMKYMPTAYHEAFTALLIERTTHELDCIEDVEILELVCSGGSKCPQVSKGKGYEFELAFTAGKFPHAAINPGDSKFRTTVFKPGSLGSWHSFCKVLNCSPGLTKFVLRVVLSKEKRKEGTYLCLSGDGEEEQELSMLACQWGAKGAARRGGC